MREKPVNVSAPHISPLVVVLLLSLAPFSSSSLRSADAGPPTAISPTPAGAGGLRTIVTPSSATTNLCSGNCVITGGTRPGGGTNLFHSFSQFNVGSGDITTFQNGISFDLSGAALAAGLPTSNILGRVTGGNISNIFGTIQTSGFGNANLFLMNPAGFLFGPNATVNVGGMVAFTTADYLRLQEIGGGNAGIFHADIAQASVLTIAPVTAFGFLGSNPGAITVQGSQLSVTPGQSISLVGGNITVQSGVLDDGTTVQPARLSAPGGQINLASLASPGEILLPNLQSAPNINGQSFTTMGNISLSQGALLDVSADPAGTVRIRGGQLVMDQATISADTVNANGAPVAIDINVSGDVSISAVDVPALTARTTGTGDAGEIRITSTNLDLTATAPNNLFVSAIDTHTSGSGKAGDVSITTTNNLTMIGDPLSFVWAIDSGTSGLDGGHGGNITLAAKHIDIETATISTGTNVANNLGEDATGSGGNLTINADSLNLTQAILVTDNPTGGAGDITISARDVQINNFSALSVTGFEKTGAIRINADQLIVDSSQIEGDNGAGPSGGITITGKVVEFKNGSTIASQTFGDQAGGDIRITASDHLTLSDDPTSDGASIRASGLYTNSSGLRGTHGNVGNAGTIVVITPSLEITGGARLDSSTRTSGQGGAITVTADTISISGERPNPIIESQFNQGPLSSGIYSRTIGTTFCAGPCGNAGPILFTTTTGSLSLNQGARIDSSTKTTGRGGDITINANQISIAGTMIDGTPGGIFSQTTGTAPGSGSGGIIALHASQFQLTDGARISASTVGPGNAGSVTIEGAASPAQSVLIDGAGSGVFTDTDATGAGGNISISAQAFTLQNGATLSAKTSGTAATATGGTITVNADTVMLTSGGTMTANSTGTGASGEVVVQGLASPAQSILIDGPGSGIFTDTQGTGAGGDIHLSANSVTVQNSGTLSATTSGSVPQATGGIITVNANQVALNGGGLITASTTGAGAGGSVTIGAGSTFASNAGTVSSTATQATGGDINITAGQSVTLSNGSLISASSSGPGNAGNILINAGQNYTSTDSAVTTQAAQASGGNITLLATGTVQLTNSQLNASVQGSSTTVGGTITIDPQYVILLNSQLLAQATQGQGGAISINITNGGLYLPDATSTVSASSQFGVDGVVTIQSPNAPASGKIIPLSQKPLIATSLLNQRCASLAGGEFSSFTVAGRDSLPTEPGGWLASPLASGSAGTGGGMLAGKGGRAGMDDDPARETVLSLRKIAPAGFLTQAFAVDESSGCQS